MTANKHGQGHAFETRVPEAGLVARSEGFRVSRALCACKHRKVGNTESPTERGSAE